MSCSYLYETHRKSEDFEHFETPKQEHSNLSDCSKEDEIWEVPEENFDNVYQQLDYNEDILEDKELEDEINKVPEVLNFNQFKNTNSFQINLSTKKIALKSPNPHYENSNATSCNSLQRINKSIKVETDTKKSMTSKKTNIATITTGTSNAGSSRVQWKESKLLNNGKSSPTSLLNFSIVPINVVRQSEKEKAEETEKNKKMPKIKLTSFSTKKGTLKPIREKGTLQNPINGFPSNTVNGSKMFTQCEISSGSEINKVITESSTSPESLLDNVLSAASSVSVKSSSLSSNGLNTDSNATRFKKDTEDCEKLLTFLPNKIPKDCSDVLKTQIPELKIIKAPNSPIHQNALNIGTYTSSPLLTVSNISHSDSFETASNQTRSASVSPLRSLSPKVPTEVSLYPDDLRCKICNELFKDPRSLNCLHSFCFQCIVNENFKQDASIPFWSQPQLIQARSILSPRSQLDDQDLKSEYNPDFQ